MHTDHPTYDPVLRPRPAADYIGIGYRYLTRMTRAGRITALRSDGGRLLYRLSDLNNYLDSLRSEVAK